jgi:hypothetical protein
MPMKRLLGTAVALSALLLVLLLAGCGGDSSSDVASDPAGGSSTPSSAAPTSAPPTDTPKPTGGAVDYTQIALVSQTAAGGTVSLQAVPLDDSDAMATFVGQFQQPGFGERIARKVAAATIPEGQQLVGAVVSIGCDVPPGVTVSGDPGAWTITPEKVASPLQECLAPVTTVAVVAVPAA